MDTNEKQLYYLSELSDYKIDDGYPDVRKWKVKDSALRNIGKVKNLLVNKRLQKVVYIDVEVDASIIDANHDPYGQSANSDLREFVNEKGQNHIIIPIGLVAINMAKEYVFTESIDHTTFASTKRIRENTPIQRAYENSVLDSYNRSVNRPFSEKVDGDVENAEVYREERMANVKKRPNVGEYGEVDAETRENEKEYDKEKERLQSEELAEDDYFYGKKEFDDSRFRNS